MDILWEYSQQYGNILLHFGILTWSARGIANNNGSLMDDMNLDLHII